MIYWSELKSFRIKLILSINFCVCIYLYLYIYKFVYIYCVHTHVYYYCILCTNFLTVETSLQLCYNISSVTLFQYLYSDTGNMFIV